MKQLIFLIMKFKTEIYVSVLLFTNPLSSSSLVYLVERKTRTPRNAQIIKKAAKSIATCFIEDGVRIFAFSLFSTSIDVRIRGNSFRRISCKLMKNNYLKVFVHYFFFFK